MIKYLVAKQKTFNTKDYTTSPTGITGGGMTAIIDKNDVYAYYHQLLSQDFSLHNTLEEATIAAKEIPLDKEYDICNHRFVKPVFKIEVSEIDNPETYKLLEYKLFPERTNVHRFVRKEDICCKDTMEMGKTGATGAISSLTGMLVAWSLYHVGLESIPAILLCVGITAVAYKQLQQRVAFFKPVTYMYLDSNKITDDYESSDDHESSFKPKFS